MNKVYLSSVLCILLSLLSGCAATGSAAGEPLPASAGPAPAGATPPPAPPASPPASAGPAATLTPAPALCQEPNGRFEQQRLPAGILGRELPLRVYLPPCYDAHRPGGYPALYLLHGQSMDESAWEDLGAGESAGRLIRDGETPPFLLVMPREEYYLQDLRESRFGEALMNELIPWVEQNYNACNERRCRAIGGISRGAVWAMRLGLENPADFCAIGAHSLPNPPMSSSRLRALLQAAPDGQPPALWLDIGQADPYYKGAAAFEATLQLLAAPHSWLTPEGTHNSAYWQAHMQEYLNWYGQQMEQVDSVLPLGYNQKHTLGAN